MLVETRFGVTGRFRAVRFGAPRRSTIRGHRHDAWHLMLVRNGACEEAVGEGAEFMTAGDFRLSGPDATHDMVFGDNGAECLVLHLGGAPFDRRLDRTGNFFVSDFAAAATLADAYAGLSSARSKLPSNLAILEGIARIRRCAAGLDPEPPEWLREAKALLSSPQSSAGGAARSARVSRERLSRAFPDFFGCTISEYRTIAATAHAITLILDGARKCEAALDAGFHDQSHMTRAVTRFLGLTPGEIRSSSSATVTSIQ